MLKLGDTNISKLFLGTTPIAKAYLGGNLVWTASQPQPYDAEVDWLEGTGTQWIETGIAGRSNLRLNTRFNVEGAAEGVFPSSMPVARSTYFGVASTSGGIKLYFCCTTVAAGTVAVDSNWHDAEVDSTIGNRYAKCDGVKIAESSSTTSYTGAYTLKLWRDYNTAATGIGKLASFSVRDTTTNQLLIDLIPVRKNGVGYMYDKVSGQLLGNSGTGAFSYGPDKPYDYEVEYIQRDCSVAWLNASGSAVTGGIDISEYLDGSSMMTATRPIEARWSTDSGSGGGTLAAIVMPANILWAGAYLGRSSFGGGYRYNNWWEYTIGTDGAPQFAIDTFHVTKASPNGSGTWTYLFDGTEVGSSQASASTNAFTNAVLIRYSSANTYQNLRMRVSFVRLGSDAYFIPVKKGTQLGFYNMVDGHLFLEEQACLSAGAIVR